MLICLLVLALVAIPAWAQQIALQNPGFEQVAADDPTMPAGWERWQAGPKQVRLDKDNPYQGAYYAALSPNPPGGGSVVLKQYFTEYQPGAEYEVVFAGRTNGVAAGRLNVINSTAVANKRPPARFTPATPSPATTPSGSSSLRPALPPRRLASSFTWSCHMRRPHHLRPSSGGTTSASGPWKAGTAKCSSSSRIWGSRFTCFWSARALKSAPAAT